MTSSCDDMVSPAHKGPVATCGADEAISSQLLTMRVEFRYLKHHTAAVEYGNGSALIYRSQFDGAGAEISHVYHFGVR